MKKQTYILILVALFITALSFAQNTADGYTKPWEIVNQLAEKQLPESALEEVESILKQAQKDKNSTETIKALVYKMRFTLEKNPEEAAALIIEFESFTEKAIDATEKAFLHSMTAESYAQLYKKDQWTINQRTDIAGVAPTNIKEWTKNIFFEKIKRQLELSLENPMQLQNTDAEKFSLLILKGEDSRILQPTLYDFLIYRKISILEGLDEISTQNNPLQDDRLFADVPIFTTLQLDTVYSTSVENAIVKTYQQLLQFRANDKNESAFIYADLQRLKYLNEKSKSEISDSLFLNSLIELHKKHIDNEIVVEVLAEIAEYYIQNWSAEENINYMSKAFEICSNGITKYPNYKRIELLKKLRYAVTKKSFTINYNSIARTKNHFVIDVKSRNISVLTLSVYRVNATAQEYSNYKQNNPYDRIVYPNRSLVSKSDFRIKMDENFEFTNSKVDFNTSDFGIYEFSLEEKGNEIGDDKTLGTFTVTNLAMMERKAIPKSGSMYILDNENGGFIDNVSVETWNRSWSGNGYKLDFINTTKTDKNGYCQYADSTNSHNQFFYFQKGDDKYFSSASSSYYHEERNYDKYYSMYVKLFSDRSIYRPGQSVYVKGIVYNTNSTKTELNCGAKQQVKLFDSNGTKVSGRDVITNEFGSFACDLILPKGAKTGRYMIQSGSKPIFISVEEYKRPTFEVKINKPNSEISFGDSVQLKGDVRAFAGYGIGNATVKYRIMRQVHQNCWWRHESEKEVCNGKLISKGDGTFQIKFIPEKSKKNDTSKNNEQFYTYTLIADVTNPNGETQSGEQSFSVGDKSLFLMVEMKDKVDKNQIVSIPLSTETLNGDRLNKSVKYNLYKLEESVDYNENIKTSDSLKIAKKIVSGTFDTNNKSLSLDMSKYVSGRYKLICTTNDFRGKEVEVKKVFILYGDNDKHPPVKSYSWINAPKTEFELNEQAKIKFGTSTTKSWVLYEIMQGNKLLECKCIPFSNEIKTFTIPANSFGKGLTVMFTFMKDYHFHTESVEVKPKENDTKLTPRLSVFRNKLLPGEKAEWTMTVSECAISKKTAEVMVDMYDASLDKLSKLRWDFEPKNLNTFIRSPKWAFKTLKQRSDGISIDRHSFEEKPFQMDGLNWFGLFQFNSSLRKFKKNNITVVGYGARRSSSLNESVELKSQDQIADVKVSVTKDAIADVIADNEVDEIPYQHVSQKPIKTPTSRTNFNETAFFYPQLRTDSMGNVKFSFTVPESITRWNVKMLAHTKDLYFGQGEAQVVTQKDLMVQMNLPRFVRRSDKLVLSANVVNLTDKELTSSVKFELIDPATDKNIQLKDAADRKVILAPNETKTVEWEISEFSPYELVTCKVIAEARNFSDGEQKYLPVLPDKVLVTESMPLILRGNETLTYNFENLLQNGSKVDNKSLTVEFSSNPTWYAIQALPTLAAPASDNAFDYMAAYCANRLAGHILNSNPKIKSVVEQWKLENGNREALLSNLEKNTELKNTLLEETPWLMAAKNETEQKKQLALLFDLNQQENQSQQYLDKLKSLQLASGGFAWFKGMTESRYATQAILLNLGRLQKIVNGQRSTDSGKQIVIKALAYLDLEIAKDFDNLKKLNKNYEKESSIDNIQLFYLHLRSEFPEIAIATSATEAFNFYTKLSEKQWTRFSLYGKAMMVVVAQRNGKIELANNILKSVKENALKTDELGMYWAKNQAGYFWNERPIAVQTAMIEAFAEVSKNKTDVEELKIWLLKQKQTQCWDSPLSTVDAVYALINYGSDWLNCDSDVKIKLGSTTLHPQNKEAGTGYFKQTIPTLEIESSMGKVILSNQNKYTNSEKNSSIAWGAMYWQYYQSLEKITQQNGVLSISKKLYLEKMNQQGKQLVPIEQAIIKKGDKIITRLVVTTERNLDFVALKDLRAACFEPVEQISGYIWKEGIGYYKTSKDASTQFFFSHLPKGTYVFEYELWANSTGQFSSGMTSLQCLYAPEFVSHSGGEKVIISNLK